MQIFWLIDRGMYRIRAENWPGDRFEIVDSAFFAKLSEVCNRMGWPLREELDDDE